MELEKLPFSGTSMFPCLRTGDKILVRPNSHISAQTGDILLAKEGAEWIAHRLIQVNGENFLKGDRSTTIENIQSLQIWGNVVGYQRGSHTVIWGQNGQPFKKLFAWLSAKNRLNLEIGIFDKWRRWICLIMILALHRMEGIWLRIVKPKPFDSFSS